jgi:hypothetical protein
MFVSTFASFGRFPNIFLTLGRAIPVESCQDARLELVEESFDNARLAG